MRFLEIEDDHGTTHEVRKDMSTRPDLVPVTRPDPLKVSDDLDELYGLYDGSRVPQ